MWGEKQSFRQKWFPTPDDVIDAANSSDESLLLFLGRWLRTLAAGGIVLYSGIKFAGNDYEYSKGMRTGMINKFSEKGLIWKTYEGQMALEGMVSNRGYAGANVWDFSLDRQKRHGENTEELAKKIQSYLESGTKVKVHYIEPFATWPWRGGTKYLIQKVESIKAEEVEEEKQ